MPSRLTRWLRGWGRRPADLKPGGSGPGLTAAGLESTAGPVLTLISLGRTGPNTGSPAISAAPQVWPQWNQITREAPLSPRPRWHVLKGFGNPVRFMNESLRSLAVIRSAVADGSLRPPGDTRAGQPAPALGLAPWRGRGPFAECPGPLEPR